MTISSFKSDKSGDMVDYLSVTSLPSGFRSYKGIKEVFVRGLYFEETLSLSKYVGQTNAKNVNYSQLAAIYSDCIRGIDFKDLEPMDLQVLLTISSLWTIDGFGWYANVDCPQIDKKTKLPCTGRIDEVITLDDFDFDTPLVKTLPIPIQIKGVEYNIGALTVGDKILKSIYLESNPEADPDLLDYAILIKDQSLTLEDKIKVIRFGNKDVYQISEIDKELLINIQPLNKKCSTCGGTSKVCIGLDKIKAFP